MHLISFLFWLLMPLEKNPLMQIKMKWWILKSCNKLPNRHIKTNNIYNYIRIHKKMNSGFTLLSPSIIKWAACFCKIKMQSSTILESSFLGGLFWILTECMGSKTKLEKGCSAHKIGLICRAHTLSLVHEIMSYVHVRDNCNTSYAWQCHPYPSKRKSACPKYSNVRNNAVWIRKVLSALSLSQRILNNVV